MFEIRIDRIIAIASLLVGIIALGAIFILQQYWIAGGLVIVLLITAGGYWYIESMDLWTVIKFEQNLIIRDGGKHAELTKRITLRANHKGLAEYIHKGIRADGEITNFRYCTKDPVPKHHMSIIAGEYFIREPVGWGIHLNRWDRVESCLYWELKNCYPNQKEEGSAISATYYTRHLVVTITLPKDKPAKDVRVIRKSPTEYMEPKKPELLDDNTIIKWEKKNIKPGTVYGIEWDW